MNQKLNPKEILTKRIKQNIKDKNWEKLSEAMPATTEYPVEKSLQSKGWFLLGSYYEEKENLIDAIKSFNKARVTDPAVIKVFDKLFAVFNSFFDKNKKLFSKSDLEKLKEALLPIWNYHQINFPQQSTSIAGHKNILSKIDYRIKFEAAEAVETPMTYPVQIIHDALYGDMTQEEVRAEFARLLAPAIREELAKKKSKDKKKESKNSIKPPSEKN